MDYWKRLFFTLAFLLPVALPGMSAATRDVKLLGLTCNYVEEPIGMGDKKPLLGWRIDTDRAGYLQGSYRVLVASDKALLDADCGDIWDSGIVADGKSQHVKFAGTPLLPCCDYYWKVKVWDVSGLESDWSPVASWRTGLFEEFDWEGEWVSSKFAELLPHRRYKSNRRVEHENWFMEDSAAVYMRREVEIPVPVRKATAFICGLGYYELYINGRKVGDRVMDPLFTDYDKRVVYATYDVTDYFSTGSNAFGILLGNGWYSLPTRDVFGMHDANWHTPPKVRLNVVVEYESGARDVIVTDRTWKWGHGEIVYNSVRSGETIDHTKSVHGWNEPGFCDSLWRNVCHVPAPLGKLTADPMPPMRVAKELKPVGITETGPGVYLVDFGENLTGWVETRVRGSRGQTVELQFNEVLKADGSLDTQNSTWHTRGRYQTELLILGGDGEETFEPRFTYHGFRYMQVRGLAYKPAPEDFTAKCVHTDLQRAGNFSCSMDKLNDLNAAVCRTLLNAVHGIPGEEPTREKMGWTLDAAVVMESYLYNFDALNTYKKALRDFQDSQSPAGHIPSTVPSVGWGYVHEDGSLDYWDDPWWGGSIFLLADKLYLYTGDAGVLESAFPSLKAYVDFLSSTAEDHIISWSLGDWLDLNPDPNSQASNLTPVAQTSTAGYYWMSRKLADYAQILGYDKRLSEHYRELADSIKDKFNREFLDYETGIYAENSQTAQALPLALGLVPDEMKEKVRQRLLDAIDLRNGHISAGFIGGNFTMDYLPGNGYFDVAYKMLTQPESPGWLHMVRSSKSTMSESINLNGPGSGHHPYGAYIGFWLYKYLGGIRADEDKPGFREFIIEPGLGSGLEEACTSYHSLYGEIVSAWKKRGGRITLTIRVPANSVAELILPSEMIGGNLRVNNTRIRNIPAISLITAGNGKTHYSVGSGTYEFRF
ncbi:alpha-L-rhamnosidase [Alistipes onderdonkii]|uniref:alpha-L-rhamnosidase n=1 Tax=Alistipes onderdonkii TaxID=328813 RepID=UPI0018AB9BEE|nr:alpha-L-rhamnosidase [Alistipes onderdonkii]